MERIEPTNDADRRPGSPPPAFLTSLFSSAAGTAVGLAAGRPAHEVPAASTWQTRLAAALGASPVLLRAAAFDVKSAIQAARRGAPLATWRESSGWVAVLDGRGDRAYLARDGSSATWMDGDALRDLLAAEADEVLEWTVVEGALDAGSSLPGAKRTPFRRLLGLVQPERRDIVAIVLYSSFIGLLTLTIPVAVQLLVNTVAFGGLVQPVIVLALLLLVGLAIAAALSAFQAYVAEIVQRRVFVRACVDLAHRLPRVAAKAFGDRPAPAYVNRFFDLVTLQKTGARLLLEGSSVLLQTSAGLIVLSFYHPLMLGLSVLLMASMSAVVFSFGRNAGSTAIRESSAKYDLAEWMEELVRHRTAFRSTGGQARAAARADELVAAWVGARREHYRIVLRQFVAALGLQVLVNSMLLALGGFLVVVGELTLGQLVASEIIVGAVVASFARLAKHFESYYDLMAAIDKVGGLLDLPLEPAGIGVRRSGSGAPAALTASGLRLGSGPRCVLDGASFELSAGEKVALIGSAGSGISTLLDVLAGIREPDAGWVGLGGEDLRELAPEVARDDILLVRGPQIVTATVIENLTLARWDAGVEDAREALEAVGLLDEIRALPDGLRTRLLNDGSPLSRSQAARLEIARAVVARPSVLLVDEGALQINDDSLRHVVEALFDPAAPWTLLVVSQDERIRRRCDRTIALEEGCVRPAAPESARVEQIFR